MFNRLSFLLIMFFYTVLGATLQDKPIVVFLNGTSSAGKSSIAAKLQERMDKMTLHAGIDHFIAMLNEKTDAAYGFICKSAHDDLGPLIIVEKGIVAKVLSTVTHQSMKIMLDHNFNLVVDELLFDEEDFSEYKQFFMNYTVYFIAIKPPLSVAMDWEKNRGDRLLGLARGLYDIVYTNKVFDLEIDSSRTTPEESAELILEYINLIPNPTAFYSQYKRQV